MSTGTQAGEELPHSHTHTHTTPVCFRYISPERWVASAYLGCHGNAVLSFIDLAEYWLHGAQAHMHTYASHRHVSTSDAQYSTHACTHYCVWCCVCATHEVYQQGSTLHTVMFVVCRCSICVNTNTQASSTWRYADVCLLLFGLCVVCLCLCLSNQ